MTLLVNESDQCLIICHALAQHQGVGSVAQVVPMTRVVVVVLNRVKGRPWALTRLLAVALGRVGDKDAGPASDRQARPTGGHLAVHRLGLVSCAAVLIAWREDILPGPCFVPVVTMDLVARFHRLVHQLRQRTERVAVACITRVPIHTCSTRVRHTCWRCVARAPVQARAHLRCDGRTVSLAHLVAVPSDTREATRAVAARVGLVEARLAVQLGSARVRCCIACDGAHEDREAYRVRAGPGASVSIAVVAVAGGARRGQGLIPVARGEIIPPRRALDAHEADRSLILGAARHNFVVAAAVEI